MSFLELPNEIILLIAQELNHFPDLNALLRTNRRLASIVSPEIINAVFSGRIDSDLWAGRLLFNAAGRADKSTFEYLIQERWILDYAYFNNGGALHHAILDRESDTVLRTLVECSEIDVNERNRYGRTPLFYATRQAHAAAVRLLLQRADIDLNIPSNSTGYFLRVAVFEKSEEVALALLEDPRTDVNNQGKNGMSALHLAARDGYDRIVRALLKRSDIQVNIMTKDGDAPLHLAEINGSEEVVRVLLADERVDINREDRLHR